MVRVNAMTAAHMIGEMLDGPSSAKMLSEVSGMQLPSVWRWMRALHKAGVIRIVGWERDQQGSFRIALYQLGRGKDAPKPSKMTNAERLRRYRAKIRRTDLAQALTSPLSKEDIHVSV